MHRAMLLQRTRITMKPISLYSIQVFTTRSLTEAAKPAELSFDWLW
jgi:hypothetical protein